ncbi:hypothetical protein Enr13x_50500 [Stieleria neptunia]|uniref:Uncharacterized protein n=1 Tax=Stieleria neptunia TaxID=2527979 RepID=A0A518HWF1_9BACT|nr:hypothetical protein [Stieleria neptunia]QDV45176.1 hypothetical protein Enr13x_50500 [Stieleria neptunia]
MVDQPQQADPRSFVRRRAVPLLAAATLASVFVAAYFAGQTHALRQANLNASTAGSPSDLSSPSSPTLPPGWKLPTLEATASASSEKFSMATGFVSDRAEGLFVLDHNSGLLQCSVMYPRLGQFLGLFVVNVHDALGTGKGAEYMMMTGMVDMPSSNNNPLASSVVYVLNTTTGIYACYYIPFNRTMMNANKPQQGNLVLLATGSADPVVDRDAIR